MKFTFSRVAQTLTNELRQIAAREGPEGALMLRDAEVTVDFTNNRTALVAKVYYRGLEIWNRRIGVSEDDMMVLKDDVLVEKISDAMRGTLTLAGQVQHAKLEKLFPGAIKNVIVTYDAEKHEKVYQVIFKNGHMAEGLESEMKTELFMARCTMLYDLPAL
jgi:hypothetical protein